LPTSCSSAPQASVGGHGLRQILQQQQRVREHIAFGMKLRRLLNSLHRRNLRQTSLEQSAFIQQKKSAAGMAFGEHLGELIAHALARDHLISALLADRGEGVSASISNSKRAAKRTARSIRNLSSAKRCRITDGADDTGLQIFAPPTKSSTSPLTGSSIMPLMVKSRRADILRTLAETNFIGTAAVGVSVIAAESRHLYGVASFRRHISG
jgi:hypothetical protein